jgi:hypothetical protein
MRTFEAMLGVTVLITLIFLGSVFLLIDIPIFNPVDPLSLELAYSGLCLGLISGFFVGVWYTKEQLKILAIKNAFKGIGSKKIAVVIYTGLAILVAFSFSMLYFDVALLRSSYVLFVISGTFALCVVRLVLVSFWEKREKKIVMQDWNRFYILPYPP